MPSPPLVSVIVPAKDAALWIGETLDSILTQTYHPDRLEIVVVDDGSTDATRALAHDRLSASGRRHQVLTNDSPLGPSAARNRGWRASAGEWVQFLDADDLLEPTKIESQSAKADAADTSLAALFSPWGYLELASKDEWKRSAPVDPQISDDPLRELLTAGNFVATGSLLFRRSWLERVGGYVESYRLVEDLDLLMRLVIVGGRLERVPSTAPTFWYRQRTTSLSRENTHAFVSACLRNLKHAESHWRADLELTSVRAEFLADEYFRLARFFAEHDVAQFEALVRDIDRLRPRFIPPRPASLRRVSQLMGYRRAERFAIHYRKLKRLLQQAPAS